MATPASSSTVKSCNENIPRRVPGGTLATTSAPNASHPVRVAQSPYAVSPSTHATGCPAQAAAAVTLSTAGSRSATLAGCTSVAKITPASVSATTVALSPSNRVAALLRPWRIAGSVVETIRSCAVPRRSRGSPSSGAVSMSWTSS